MVESKRGAFVSGVPDERDEPECLAPGVRVGSRYVIGETLGVGGSSVVYAARDLELRREVALKILREDRTTASTLRRFRREVAIAREIASPRLVRVFDIHEIDGRVCISMERVEGASLRDRLAMGGPFSPAAAITITREVLHALITLHDSGIVHRDVKPGNILIDATERVLLADFGLAIHTDRDETRATATADVVGTYGYLSPEQALGKDCDERSDLYSLGIVLYEMLSGVMPFRRSSGLATVAAQIHERAPDVRSLRPDTPRWLAQLVGDLLEKDPERRPSSAAEVVRRIDEQRYSLRHALRGRKPLTIAALLVAGLLLGGVAGARWYRDSRFATFEKGFDALHVRDRAGRELWSLPGRHDAVLARDHNGRSVLAVLPVGGSREEVLRLQLRDLQSGRLLRSVMLPDLMPVFPAFSRRIAPDSNMRAIDMDGDGSDEIFVTFTHVIYWPAYTVVYDTRTARMNPVLVASGRHVVAGDAELDGDPMRELVFVGINNRMGWTPAVAALNYAEPQPNDPGFRAPASTPDEQYPGTTYGDLLWYKLLPPALVPDPAVTAIDHDMRRIVVKHYDGTVTTLGFDGFQPGGEGDPVARNELRDHTHRLLRQATEMGEGGQPGDAAAKAGEAIALARKAGDVELAEWAERVRIRSLIEAGEIVQAERELADLRSRTVEPAAVVWDAALALHLRGELALAAKWYSAALVPEQDWRAGRLRYEFLEGAVLALGELGRWDEAQELVQRVVAMTQNIDGTTRHYERWIDWRSGASPTPVRIEPDATDFARYVNLELRLERGEDPDALLRAIGAFTPEASEARPLLRSLRAEVLMRMGRTEEAARDAREAWRAAEREMATSTHVRAHADLIRERAARIGGAAQ